MRKISPVTGRPYRLRVDGSVDGRSRQCRDGVCSCGYNGPVVTSRKHGRSFCQPCYSKLNHSTYVERKGKEVFKQMLRDNAEKYRPAAREAERRYRQKLKETNPKKLAAKSSAWKSLLRKATPKWLGRLGRKVIQEFYENRPEGHHVDHIIPIRGENVCGLHVIWNLQYLPAVENMKKGNRT